MKIGINCGHTQSGSGYGAVGFIKESEHTRLVGNLLMKKLINAGVEVVNCTVDKADTQNAYLKKSVEIANKNKVDLFISIHFNASANKQGNGTEVFTYGGAKHEEAVKICKNISDLGFNNRGIKDGSNLYVVKNTSAKAILIEVCFCDNEKDVSTYLTCGEDKIAKAIFDALGIKETGKTTDITEENRNMNHDEFIEFVGNIASKDWSERHLVLPSIVVAQAIKESAWGTSELAKNANALFGIKQNGWTGNIYYKDATEQNKDGTYRKDTSVAWRAYDSSEQSIIDHNTYIAERKVGNQTEPNFKEVIGETDLKKAISGLVGDEYRQQSAEKCTDSELKQYVLQGKTQFGYATSHTYAQSLLSDYIKKYNLTKFDGDLNLETQDDNAPDGMLYVVQLGAYKSKKNAENFINRLERMGVKSMLKLYHEN